MKRGGHFLIMVGFLLGAWVAVQQEGPVNWRWYLPAFVLGVLGVVLARRGTHSEARAGDALSLNVQTLKESLARIVRNIDELEAQKSEMNPYDARGRIDELFPDDLTNFADARESIAHRFGLQAYANIMNHFAAGERYLNRVWSASVDGYIDEVQEYIGRSREQFTQAQEKLQALEA